VLSPSVSKLFAVAASPKTQRFVLNLLVFLIVFSGLVGFASLLYAGFYYLYIPQVAHQVPIHIQFPHVQNTIPESMGVSSSPSSSSSGTTTTATTLTSSAFSHHSLSHLPYADIPLTTSPTSMKSILTSSQRYDLSVVLSVPESVHNLGLGPFMVSLELSTLNNRTLGTSSRSVMLKHKTELVRWITTLWKSIPIVLGWVEEKQEIKVKVFEGIVEDYVSILFYLIF